MLPNSNILSPMKARIVKLFFSLTLTSDCHSHRHHHHRIRCRRKFNYISKSFLLSVGLFSLGQPIGTLKPIIYKRHRFSVTYCIYRGEYLPSVIAINIQSFYPSHDLIKTNYILQSITRCAGSVANKLLCSIWNPN